MVAQKNTLHGKGGLLASKVVRLPDGKNHLTMAELVHGVGVLGSAGSGKTSGVGASLMHTQVIFV